MTAESFGIRVASLEDGTPVAQVTIGNFVERTKLDLADWTCDDYEQQWRNGLAQLCHRDGTRVTLMTWGGHPNSRTIRRAWRLHRCGDHVRIQERLYVPEDHEFMPDEDGVIADDEDFARHTEDGERISEWSTTVQAIRDFLAS